MSEEKEKMENNLEEKLRVFKSLNSTIKRGLEEIKNLKE